VLVIANSSAAASGVIATTATGTREIVRASGPGSVVPAICMTAIVGTSRDGDQWLWTHVARGRAVLPSKKWLTLLMKIVSGPEVVQRPEIPYVAFRDRIPFKGFATHTAAMHAELARWLHQHPVDTTGPQFLRLHVIDLSDRATVSVAIPVASVDVAAQAVEADEDPRMVADAIPRQPRGEGQPHVDQVVCRARPRDRTVAGYLGQHLRRAVGDAADGPGSGAARRPTARQARLQDRRLTADTSRW